MVEVQMTAGVTTGDQYETVHYPGDEIMLRVTRGGNVQVIEYISTDREGPPPHFHLSRVTDRFAARCYILC